MYIRPRKIRRENNWVEYPETNTVAVELTKGYYVILDRADWEWLRVFRLVAMTIKNKSGRVIVYAAANVIGSDGKGKLVLLHRLIMNPPDNMIVDHVNLNTLDCTRKNLRIVTRSNNLQNTGCRKDSTTGEKNIYRQGNRYEVIVMVDGKRYSFGRFEKIEDAITVRNNILPCLIGKKIYRSHGQAFSTSGCPL